MKFSCFVYIDGSNVVEQKKEAKKEGTQGLVGKTEGERLPAVQFMDGKIILKWI